MDRLIQQASSFASEIDGLVMLVTVLVGFWFIAAEIMFFWLIFRFRKRDDVPTQYLSGKEKHVKRWVNIPHYLVLVCDVFIIIAAVKVWVHVKQTMPPADSTIRVVGYQWAWVFTHPGPDGMLDTPDDIRTSDDLHVEVGKTYHFKLESRDVLHSFSVPVFRLKQDSVPGRIITGWFKPTKAGEFDIQCAEICGIGHGIMAARLHVDTAEQHQQWLAKNSAIAVADDATGETPTTTE